MNNKLVFAGTALAAVLALSGCNKAGDDTTAGQKVDSAIASAKQEGSELKSSAGNAAADAKAAAERGVQSAADATKDSRAKAGDAISDATITTKVKAELARDTDLSAIAINVDTDKGRVKLAGTAPTPTAKERATSLASAVEGVSGVDNQLTVVAK